MTKETNPPQTKQKPIVTRQPRNMNEQAAEQPQTPKRGLNKFLILSTTIVNLTSFTVGITRAWLSPVIPKLNEQTTSPLAAPTTALQESLMAAASPLGAFVAPFLTRSISEKWGRKKILTPAAAVSFSAFLIAAYSTKIYLFYLARLLMGFSLGAFASTIPVFFVEIAEKHNRGLVSCTYQIFCSLGVLWALAVGPFFTVKEFSLLCLFPVSLFIPLFTFLVPETPFYYAKKYKMEQLKYSLEKYRHSEEESFFVQKICAEKKSAPTLGELLTAPNLKKPLLLAAGLILFQNLTGLVALNFFLQSIFIAVSNNDKISPESSAIVVGVVQVIATCVAMLLVDRLGRRPLLLASYGGTCLSLVSLGAYFHLQNANFDMRPFYWVPVVSVIAFFVSVSVGLRPLPMTITTEIFPPNFKSSACALHSSLWSAMVFFQAFLFRILIPVFGLENIFLGCALCTFAGGVFVWRLLPETKNKSYEEIRREFEE